MRKLVFILLFPILSSYAQSEMSRTEAMELEAKVKRLAVDTETISSDFIQYKHMDFLSNDIVSTGKMYFKSPNLVKWEYVTPYQYSVLFKEETLYIDNEGNKSQMDIGSSNLFKQLNKLITDSVKGDMFDTKEFRINYYNKEGINEVHFVPKDTSFASYIKSFQLTFTPKGEVIEVKMLEPSDDYTRIVFSNRKTNQSLPDAVFDH